MVAGKQFLGESQFAYVQHNSDRSIKKIRSIVGFLDINTQDVGYLIFIQIIDFGHAAPTVKPYTSIYNSPIIAKSGVYNSSQL